MKDLFMCLLQILVKHGDLTETNMYRGGNLATITVKADDGTYEVLIKKKEVAEDES